MTTTTVPVGQTVTGVVINSGDEQDVYGTAIDTTDGGFQVVDGGTAADTTITNQGFQLVDLGGTATGTTINYGSQQVNNGSTATDTTMKAGCYQWVFGTVTDTIMNGGVQYDYGTAIDTTDGGFQVVELGGTATGTAINNTGVVVVLGGGTAIDTTINSFGQQVVSGTAIGTTINLYGYQAVGGTATGTTIDGGYQSVYGTATNTTINGGEQYVYSNLNSPGMATDTTINGGDEVVASGGTATNTTISRGLLDLQAGAITSGVITFAGIGTLEIDQSVSGAMSFATPLVNIMGGDTIDLTGLGFATGSTATVSGSQLTVSNGTASEIFMLTTPDTTTFWVSEDISGGTLVTAVAVPANANFITLPSSSTGNLGTIGGNGPTVIDASQTQNVTFSAGNGPHVILCGCRGRHSGREWTNNHLWRSRGHAQGGQRPGYLLWRAERTPAWRKWPRHIRVYGPVWGEQHRKLPRVQ